MSMKMILCRVNCSMMIFCILCDVLKLNLMKRWLKLALRFSDAASLKYWKHVTLCLGMHRVIINPQILSFPNNFLRLLQNWIYLKLSTIDEMLVETSNEFVWITPSYLLVITVVILTDDDDDEDYEEPGGGNHFLGFMFGNVDDSGDLDADYLDEVQTSNIWFCWHANVLFFVVLIILFHVSASSRWHASLSVFDLSAFSIGHDLIQINFFVGALFLNILIRITYTLGCSVAL